MHLEHPYWQNEEGSLASESIDLRRSQLFELVNS